MTNENSPSSFLASLSFDKKLSYYDVTGSKAWARALERAGVLSETELKSILSGLDAILVEISKEDFPFREELEDIHFNIERRLIELIGPLGGKLHSGRSRNDQIATDMRLYSKDAVSTLIDALRKYQLALVNQAEKNLHTILPGYTHLQRAQPILLAHHLMAYFEMADRDINRLQDCFKRIDFMPLGSAALAGTAYNIDRELLAKDLGFSNITLNSLDAVSDRDFVVDIEYTASMIMLHLSRLAEEIILWSSVEFSYVKSGDEYTSGSSIMPQKNNPDIAELIRGKVGRVSGALIGTIVTLKALPLAYNRDLQEDKEPLFDVIKTLDGSLSMMSGLVTSLEFNVQKMKENSEDGAILATELADYLVNKGVPFRDSHGIVRELVQKSLDEGLDLKDLDLAYYKESSEYFDDDVLEISAKSATDARSVLGGTSENQVQQRIIEARRRMN
jgi:argininosuccinate lyase